MEQEWRERIDTLLSEFLLQDDLQQLALDTGMLLRCPLLVLDDTFHVRAHFLPPSFSDEVFRNAVRCGEITYEAGVLISKSTALSSGTADYIKLVDSVYPRRFAPLISAGVRLGYLNLRGYGRPSEGNTGGCLADGGSGAGQAAVRGDQPAG